MYKTGKFNFLIFLIIFSFIHIKLYSESKKILVLESSSKKKISKVTESFGKNLEILFGKEMNLARMTYSDKYKSQYTDMILKFSPDIALALGDEAVELLREIGGVPFIYVMVNNPEVLGLQKDGINTGNYTGISSIVDPKTQLKELKEKLPQTQIVGLLYSDKNTYFKDVAEKAAGDLGITLISEYVKVESGVVKECRVLAKSEIDVFWMVQDKDVLNDDTFNYFTEGCQLRQVNMLSFDKDHLKKGATVVVEATNKGLGKQAADLIAKIIDGEEAINIPVEYAKSADTHLQKNNIYR